MPKVTLNKNEYEDVDPKFLDAITNRLSGRLAKIRSDRVAVDTLSISSEMQRLYGQAIALKPWYKDYIAQFCSDRRIPCDLRVL